MPALDLDYELDYLRALVNNDTDTIRAFEEAAASRGYATSHRMPDGTLKPGQLVKHPGSCSAKFAVYVPLDLAANPHIVMLCTSPHSHAPPERSMTPPAYRDAFEAMLKQIDWRLADATPRNIVQDSGFMNALRNSLRWSGSRNPVLADLHPSLQNLDHAAYLIDQIRKPMYPAGTDFEGARHLYETQLSGPPEEQYVRFVGEIPIPGEKPARMVICMSRTQSERFLKAKRIEMDSAFNRVQSSVEFEVEEWDSATSQSVTLCRAFISSQSAEAHRALFLQIFRIVKEDTGQDLHFHHLHGDGIEKVTADEHKGQGKGFGLALQDVAAEMTAPDPYEPWKRLCDLTAYDHLARIYRICLVHYQRNVKKLEAYVSPDVLSALYSLASTEPHKDFDGAKEVIRAGGKKAAGPDYVRDWLKDKEIGTPFALPALYYPLSKIPIDIWRANKPNSNGVEQKHRNVNRDGKHLSMLGGIFHGMQHDVRERRSGDMVIQEGIHPRYRPAHEGMREERAFTRKIHSEKRKIAASQNTGSPKGRKKKKARPTLLAVPAPPVLVPPFLVPSQAGMFPPHPQTPSSSALHVSGAAFAPLFDITNWEPQPAPGPRADLDLDALFLEAFEEDIRNPDIFPDIIG
ncbi:hypothetical protein AURDEDRAFT_125039 [Auricularia subglabra TFB-10046 SS5]|nr:hypothetical protein AURDEDRAFT_125039 [Auricularia subglabra TFB-10046 SS5]